MALIAEALGSPTAMPPELAAAAPDVAGARLPRRAGRGSPRPSPRCSATPSPAERAAAALGDARELVCVARGYLRLRRARGGAEAARGGGGARRGLVVGRLPPRPGDRRPSGPAAAGDLDRRSRRRPTSPSWPSASSRPARACCGSPTAPGADLPLPGGLAEPLLAIPASVRAQQLALAVARRRGLDPDEPPGLGKVTPTT